MRTLRAKLTVLLVAAILCVVVIATLLSFFVIARPPAPPRDDLAAARQLALVLDVLGHVSGRLDESSLLTDRPPPGVMEPVLSRELSAALARLGHSAPVSVIREMPPGAPGDAGGGPPPEARPPHEGGEGRMPGSLVATVRLADGRWLVFPISGHGMPPPPPTFPLLLAAWLALVTLGVTGVVVVAVQRLMRPLGLLEKAVEEMGADGTLPPLEERGPTEVRAAARALNSLSTRLKTAMESRMRIVAAAAHDLRTPLTRLRLRAEFIEDEEERQQWFADLAELDRIADSAIRLVREEAEDGPDEVVALHELAATVVAETRQASLPAELIEAPPLNVLGRPLSLKRAIRNLVMNAATHGKGARVRLWGDDSFAHLLIEDDGPGIPQHLMARVFEPFFRTDPARQVAIPGAGLGLAIAHEIVERHGGQLVLSNRAGGGLAQQVALPLAPTA